MTNQFDIAVIGAVRWGYGGRLVHAVGDAATAAMAAAKHCQG